MPKARRKPTVASDRACVRGSDPEPAPRVSSETVCLFLLFLQVTFVLDQGILKHEAVLAHPLVNTATLSLPTSAMLDFVKVNCVKLVIKKPPAAADVFIFFYFFL
jgi:hypothetical protein